MSEFWNQMNYPEERLKVIFNKINYPDNEDECWIWTSYKNKDGYGMTSFEGKIHRLVHRIIFECYNGPIPDKMLVLHTCDNPPCCNPNHLFLGTVSDNVKDRVNKQRSASGERNNKATMTDQEIYQILTNINNGKYKSIAQICQECHISRRIIENILRGENWLHISKDFDLKYLRSKIINPNCISNKLTEQQIEKIKYDVLKLGKSQNSTAKKYNIGISTVFNIVHEINQKYKSNKG